MRKSNIYTSGNGRKINPDWFTNSVHMKDISALGNRNTPIEGGRGILDSKSILAALLKIKYQGLVGFEYEKDGKDPVPGLAESVGYIKGLLAGMK